MSEKNGAKIKPWTVAELATLRQHAQLGAVILSRILDRTVASIQLQAHRQRISLRTPGTRRGRVLGDPAGTLRTVMLDDPAYATDLAQTVKASTRPVPLCPLCVARPQHRSLGMCRPCHTRALADAHRDAQAQAAANRDLNQARQAKHRTITGDPS